MFSPQFPEFLQKILFSPAGSLRDLVFAILILWSLFWKGMALWRAARHSQKVWFVALLVVNTVGILEIIYIAFFQKKALKEAKGQK